MDGTTGDTVDQQLQDLYGELKFHQYTDNNQRLRLRANGSCDPSPTCLALQDLITSSQETFRGRKNSKALIKDVPPLLDKAMGFVKGHGVNLPSIEYSDSMDIKSSQESCVLRILMLEGERMRTQKG
jgi:hypothetical protein